MLSERRGNIAVIGIVEAVIKEYQATDFNIAFSGTPFYQYHVEPMLRANMKKMCIAILIVPVLLMPFLFGRGSGAILPQVTAILFLGGFSPTVLIRKAATWLRRSSNGSIVAVINICRVLWR
jgi:hypothetical protein